MSEFDDKKIHDLLKKSPTLTPPESFYRGVLDKIESPHRPTAPSPSPWFMGWPVKSFATACLLLVLVLVTREKQKGSSDLRKVVLEERMADRVETVPQSKSDASAGARASAVDSNGPLMGASSRNLQSVNEKKKAVSEAQGFIDRTRQGSAKDSPASILVDDKRVDQAVQEHLHRDLTPYAANPSPFAEEDEALRKDLSSENKAVLKTKARAAVVLQARNTADGVASQASFLDQENALRQKAGEPILAGGKGLAPAAAALSMPKSIEGTSAPAEPWKGVSSGITTPRTVVIRSPGAWADLWKEHSRGQDFSSTPPGVDFNTSMVVAVFAGTKPTSGYEIDILDVQKLADHLVVTYRIVGEGSPLQVLTQPYQFRLIPNTRLAVIFQRLN